MSFDKESFVLGKTNGSVSGDIITQKINVVKNGTYTAESGKAYSSVTVNVAQIETEALSVTENGKYKAAEGKAYNEIDVGVKPLLQDKTVTENGEITADLGYDGLGKVTVKVDTGGTEIVVPDGYTQMEYLESSGAQFIKTGHNVSNDTVFEVLFRNITTGDQYLFGVNTQNENEGCYFDVARSIYFRFGVGSYQSFSILADAAYHMKISRNGVYNKSGLPGEEIKVSGNSNTALEGSAEIYLFARNNVNDATVSFSKIRVGRYTVYEGETMVQDMVPALRNSDSVLGMYDILNDIFYINSGTGAFSGGALD